MAEAACGPERLPVGSFGLKGVGWWGVLTLIATEAALFAYLLFSYFYFAVHQDRSWYPDPLPAFRLSGPNTVILILSSLAVWWGERGARRAARGQQLLGLLAGLALGVVFVCLQLLEWSSKNFTPSSSSYGSLYFTITGFHLAHVVAGLLALLFVSIWSGLGYFDRIRHAPVTISAAYWHFVDVVWITVFFCLYVTPRLG